ncbi:MAG: GYF domain-containing protein [Hyphomicrobiaceae bacterium]
MIWFLSRDGEQWGPYSQDEWTRLQAEGRVRPTDVIWNSKTAEWTPAGTLEQAGAAAPSVATATRKPATASRAERRAPVRAPAATPAPPPRTGKHRAPRIEAPPSQPAERPWPKDEGISRAGRQPEREAPAGEAEWPSPWPPSGTGNGPSPFPWPSKVPAGAPPAVFGAAQVAYILNLLFFIPVLPILGLLVALGNREAKPEWLATHFRWQVRTFGLGFILFVIATWTMPFGVGALVMVFAVIWWVKRQLEGFKALGRGEPIRNPNVFW